MTHNSKHFAGTLSNPFARRVLALILAFSFAQNGFADTGSSGDQAASPPPAPPTPAASTTQTAAAGEVTRLEKYTVTDVPITEQILPTVRPINSVYGDDLSIVDIPRSVTSVNKAWMDERQVKNAMDFGQFATGVYSEAQYGIPAVPFIRGDLAQIYMDGQIMLYTRNSVPPSFNGVEALDIVKGPGSAVYGPQGEGAGGYVNFVTKQPFLDAEHLEITATLSSWTSGRSYFNPELTIDFGGPLSDKLAYRISYLSRYGDNYYIHDKNQTQDVFAAVTYLATKTLKLEWWAEAFGDRTNEVSGTNRVTQQFIWNGTYVAGPVIPNYGNDTIPPGGTVPTVSSDVFSVIQPTGTVKLPPYIVLVGPSDVARSLLVQQQLVSTLTLTPESALIDRLFLADGHSNKVDTYGYDEYTPVQQSFQDRLEYHALIDLGKIENSLIAGADFRYSRLVAYTDFSNEPFSSYDLSASTDNFYPAYAASNNTFGGGYRVPGTTTYSSMNVPDAQDSHIYDSALFVQDYVKLLSKLSTILGLRYDYIKADDKSPSEYQVGEYDQYEVFHAFTTPVYVPLGSLYSAWGSAWDPSYFASIVFKMTDTSSLYLTYDRVDAVLGTSNFGGLNAGSSDPVVAAQQLHTSITSRSTLYETGYKQSFLHNTLYVDASLFQQLKFGTQQGGPDYLVKDNGIELEAVYQPSKALSVNANFTYQDATAFAPSGYGFYQQSGNYLDPYPTTYMVDGQYGTGVGSPNFTSYYPPGGRMRAPGIPQLTANFFIEYKFANGFGAGLGPQIIGRQYANDQDTLHIPGEYSLDGYLFYQRKRWDVRVNIRNLANQRLVDTIDVSFAGNDTIFVRQPISASLTFRLHL